MLHLCGESADYPPMLLREPILSTFTDIFPAAALLRYIDNLLDLLLLAFSEVFTLVYRLRGDAFDSLFLHSHTYPCPLKSWASSGSTMSCPSLDLISPFSLSIFYTLSGFLSSLWYSSLSPLTTMSPALTHCSHKAL